MDEQKSLLNIQQEEENKYDSHRNSIINLKKFQIKKIIRNENDNHKKIEIKLSELMDNKIKYKKNKISNKLYVVKTKKILNKAKPTPYQLYENIKKEILSRSILSRFCRVFRNYLPQILAAYSGWSTNGLRFF